MSNERRMTTDRFYGGISNRLRNLRLMLEYLQDEQPSRSQLNNWVISNTKAGSPDAVSHHLTFLESIRLVKLSETECEVGEYGQKWLRDHDPKTLYEALSSGVKGFDTILEALRKEPMTDEAIMNLLVTEFDEAEMSTPGPAVRHREWLQVLGFIEREDGVNRLAPDGYELLEAETGPGLKQGNTDISWLDAMRLELKRFRNQRDKTTVTLHEIYDFSESRLSTQFPDNDHVRAKIRQLLQRLRDRGEIEFLDDRGKYKIKELNFDDSLDSFVTGLTGNGESSSEEVEEEKTKLDKKTQSEPELTDNETTYAETRRKVRDHAFTEIVRETYENTCAMCGSRRESPTGNPEVEAAHIYPKSENGSDDIRNGMALCKLHHWGFDSGWFSFSDDYEILVKDAPERNGYHEFKQLEGQQLRLPDEDQRKPHAMFLKEHRRLNGFDNE